MTDEEMAEYSFSGRKLLYKSSNDKRSYKDGFLAGLEAGRSKWHKVADGDLPKEKVDVYVLYSWGEVDVKHLEWNKEWWGNGTYCSLTGVTHWKEIVLPEEIEHAVCDR